ncbi:MAG: hypothetical protein WC755_06655 [Candidatus Woesearchaeota archaeon]|jgi:hypothetical protein
MGQKEDSIFYSVPVDSQPLRERRYYQEEQGPVSQSYDLEKNKREQSVSMIGSIVYWISLFAAIIGNFITSVILIPFMIMIQSQITLYIIIMVMGLVFGALFNFLLTDLQKLDTSHHVMSGAVIPALAVINVYIMVEVSKVFGTSISVPVNQNAFVIALLYVSMFIVPYIVSTVAKHYKIVTI